MFLTADEGPQVKSHGALQRLEGSAKGIEEEAAGGHGGEEDHNTTEEDDGDMKACWDGTQQFWKDCEREQRETRRLTRPGERKHSEPPTCIQSIVANGNDQPQRQTTAMKGLSAFRIKPEQESDVSRGQSSPVAVAQKFLWTLICRRSGISVNRSPISRKGL